MNVSQIKEYILKHLLIDFRHHQRTSGDLRKVYEGPSIPEMRKEVGEDSSVDFDLALKDLVKEGLIKTGPMVPHRNPPGSNVIIIGMRSDELYAHLTEGGYKEVQGGNKVQGGAPQVSITESHFYQSPVGVGVEVRQTTEYKVESESDAVKHLIELLQREGQKVDDATTEETAQLVKHAKEGDFKTAKTIFQKMFGVLSDGARQVAWGIISAVLAKQMGL